MEGCGPCRAAVCAQIEALESDCECVVQPVLGHHIVWRRVGSGPPLVLLHGGHGSWLHWARVIPDLSFSFTLWMPDMPGYGDSTLTPTQGLDELVAQLRQGLDDVLGARTPILLCGFSFGGLVSAQLAAQRDHVQRLVLIGPAGHGGPRRQTVTPLPWRDLDPDADPVGWANRMRHNLLAQMLHSETAVDALALEIQWRGCLNTRFRSKPFSRSAALASALSCYPGEVLTIWGEHDVTAVPRDMTDGVAPQGASRRQRVVDGAGHWLMHERYAATTLLIRQGLTAA